jgi:hypothetical protein
MAPSTDEENPLSEEQNQSFLHNKNTRAIGSFTDKGSTASQQYNELSEAFSAIPLSLLFCVFGIAMIVPTGVGSYAIYVGSKFRKDGNPQCRADAVWLIGNGIIYIGVPILTFFTILSMRAKQTLIGQMFTILSCLSCCFSFAWMIYCVVLFFTEPVCTQFEAHLFGKILAWIFTIQFSCMGLGLICGICGMCFLCISSLADR